ncbi:hypothetical protein [Roseomonas sp. BN140053]|uniref:hypothetical protein n=1 Tax=Roseomonas sp. BN140053 TaxID=3391898 RepID=UPI0039EB1FC6
MSDLLAKRRLLALLFSTLALPALAQTPGTLQRSGSWETFFAGPEAGATAGSCGVSRQLLGRGFVLRTAADGGETVALLHRDTWRIPAEARMNVAFEVDGRTLWIGQFAQVRTGRELSGVPQTSTIEAVFPSSEAVSRFTQGFASGSTLVIRFLDGNEGTWRAPLAGSQRAIDAFADCLQAAGPGQNSVLVVPSRKPATPDATQPFDAPRPN